MSYEALAKEDYNLWVAFCKVASVKNWQHIEHWPGWDYSGLLPKVNVMGSIHRADVHPAISASTDISIAMLKSMNYGWVWVERYDEASRFEYWEKFDGPSTSVDNPHVALKRILLKEKKQ